MQATPGETLQDRDRLFRLLVESVRDYAIFMLDTEGRITSWNPGAQRIKGYAAEEVLGRHFSIFFTEADRAAGKPEAELRKAAADGRAEDEAWRVRRDGTAFWANVVISSLVEEDRLIGYAKVTRDLTERMTAELRTREDARRLAEAEAADRAKSEFLTALSHELRTPLNAIAGYADLLLLGIRGPVTEQQADDLRRIKLSQQHLLAIINDLLNYSRIGSGTVNYSVERVALAAAVDAVLSMIGPQAAAKEIELVNAAADTQLAALADGAKVQQVMLNLLTNAVKYSPAGTVVTVSCGMAGDNVAVLVSDTGPGIPVEHLENIFEPFVQVGRTLTSSHEGAGLGLAISRDLARAMGGDITVDSEPGRGSSFTLSLPAA